MQVQITGHVRNEKGLIAVGSIIELDKAEGERLVKLNAAMEIVETVEQESAVVQEEAAPADEENDPAGFGREEKAQFRGGKKDKGRRG